MFCIFRDNRSINQEDVFSYKEKYEIFKIIKSIYYIIVVGEIKRNKIYKQSVFNLRRNDDYEYQKQSFLQFGNCWLLTLKWMVLFSQEVVFPIMYVGIFQVSYYRCEIST